MGLQRFDGIYFMEYGDSQQVITRLFRFYAEEMEVKSIFLTGGGIDEQKKMGLGKTLNLLDTPNLEGVMISKYQLNDNYQLKFTLGKEEFAGSLLLNHSMIMVCINEKTNVNLIKVDLVDYIKSKELY